LLSSTIGGVTPQSRWLATNDEMFAIWGAKPPLLAHHPPTHDEAFKKKKKHDVQNLGKKNI